MTANMKRREFITLLGGAAVAWPAAARAERAPLPVIGYLSARTAEDSVEVLAEFRRGLGETGFVEGHNVAIEYRWLAGRYDLLPEFIGDLVRRRVSVIAIPSGSSSALAAKAATQTIPIVFNIGSDPVAIGLVASLSHPGKNATGIGMLQTAVAAKRVELLREMVPTAGSIALLVNPANPAFANPEAKQVQEAVRVLGLKLLVVNASTPSEIDAAFATMVQQQIGALVVGGEAFCHQSDCSICHAGGSPRDARNIRLARTSSGGALMCYGAPVANTQRSLGIYTGRILKGEKPGDLPVQQVTKLQLIINLTTAKALGLDVPPSLLARADEVIE